MARDKTDKTDTTPATPATTATRVANEWGIPDWRDSSAYGDTNKPKPLERWRWEFVRRNSEYRSEALAFFGILEAREKAAEAFRRLKTPEAREQFLELADRQEQAYSAFWRRWGYCGVLDPRIAKYPNDDLKILHHDRANIMDGSPSSEAGRSSISPRIGQTAIVFNLDRPLQEQMKTARAALKKRQNARHDGKAIQQRRHPTKWIGYLRTLDAREAGASWAEISVIHPNTAQTEQTARDIWNAAHALRFNF